MNAKTLGMIAGTATLGLAAMPAAADVIEVTHYLGSPAEIADDAYDGTLASMLADTIYLSVGPLDGLITDINVTVGMDHTWMGDLTIKFGNGSALLALVNRAGIAGGPDDGTGCCGDSSNLSAEYGITYDDEAASGLSAELMGDGIDSAQIIGLDSPNNYTPDPDGAAGLGSLAGFDGSTVNGAYTIYIGDSAGGDVGALSWWSVRIEYTEIPAPGALALLGLAGLAGRRRRA